MKSLEALWNQGGWKIALFFVVLAIFVYFLQQMVAPFMNGYGLPILSLLGVVTLLGALLIFTALMNAIGMSDQTQALGLPEGSVRALLALALLGLFAILASSVLGKPDLREFKNLTAADAADYIKSNPGAVQTTYQDKDGKVVGFGVQFYAPQARGQSRETCSPWSER